MDVVVTRNETVEASFKALNDLIKPVIKRKDGRLRTCGSRDSVGFHASTGRLDSAMLSKPTRWIVRIEGDLDQADELTVHAERCIGSFNLNGGADILGVRILLLHRKNPEDAWGSVPSYEHRLLILSRPPFPVGSSSNTVHCISAVVPDQVDPDDDISNAAQAGEPAPLKGDLWLQRRYAPAQRVTVESTLLLSPRVGSIKGLSQAHQQRLEKALFKTLSHWSLFVWRGESGSKAAVSFVRAFDELEAPSLADTLSESDMLEPEQSQELPPDVLRRARKALQDGFQRFVIVSPDPSLCYALGDVLTSQMETPPERVSLLYDSNDTLASIGQSDAWILQAARQQEALTVLDRACVDQAVVWLSIPRTFDGLSLLKKAYTQNGMEVPDDSVLSSHVLLRTANIVEKEAAGALSPRVIEAFFQVCLHHASGDDWQSLRDDTLRQVWIDAMVMLFPSMLAGLPHETRNSLLTRLCEKLAVPVQEERLLKTLLAA